MKIFIVFMIVAVCISARAEEVVQNDDMMGVMRECMKQHHDKKLCFDDVMTKCLKTQKKSDCRKILIKIRKNVRSE